MQIRVCVYPGIGGLTILTLQTDSVGFAWVAIVENIIYNEKPYPNQGPWSEHGTAWYSCNRYDDQSGVEARDAQSRSRASLERYLHVSI
jgi:hypothetical protein